MRLAHLKSLNLQQKIKLCSICAFLERTGPHAVLLAANTNRTVSKVNHCADQILFDLKNLNMNKIPKQNSNK